MSHFVKPKGSKAPSVKQAAFLDAYSKTGVVGNAIVMELVPGEMLRAPLPVNEALAIARQIAEALEAAHDKGVTRTSRPTMTTTAGWIRARAAWSRITHRPRRP